MKPVNDLTSVTVLGLGQLRMVSIFLGSVAIPFSILCALSIVIVLEKTHTSRVLVSVPLGPNVQTLLEVV